MLFSFVLVTISKSGVIKIEVQHILITFGQFSFKHCQGLSLSHLLAVSHSESVKRVMNNNHKLFLNWGGFASQSPF